MNAMDVVERMRASYTGGGIDGSLLAEDVVCEWPFAPPGSPKRLVGRDALLERARVELPFRLDEARVNAVHETRDPEVLIVELTLGGTLTASGERREADLVALFRVRAGKVVLWREYQDTYAVLEAMKGV